MQPTYPLMRFLGTCATAMTLIVVANLAHAQEPVPGVTRPQLTFLRVEITIARYRGDALISSLPYTLSVTADSGQTSQLRMGADVPLERADAPPEYRSVGTNIDCTAFGLDSGRFRLLLAIEETTIYAEEESQRELGRTGSASTGGSPVFRSFRSENSVILVDGGSAQLSTASDRISGEVVRATVILTVLE